MLKYLAAVTAAAAATLMIGTAAQASPGPIHRPQPDKLWLIKDNDLAVIGQQYAPLFRWVVCGVATGGGCAPGQVPTFASYPLLQQAIADGQLVRGDTILFDQEPWSATPAYEARNPVLYAKLIGKLCQANGIRLVFTAAGHGLAGPLAVDVAAAPYAYTVGVQTQKLDGDPVKFYRYARRAALALRAVNRHVKVMIGLAPDAGGTPVTVNDMVREYVSTYQLADGFWLNSAVWRAPRGTGCAPVGCPVLSDRFLARIIAINGLDR